MVDSCDKEDSRAIEIATETERQIDKDGYTKDPATDPWNEHISVQVSSLGRFNMGANPNPSNGGSQPGSFNMMYAWPSSPGTSYSTVRVDGQDFIYGSSGTVVQPPVDDNDAGINRSSWMLPGGIKVTQTMTIVEGQGTGKKDTAEIRYELENTSSAEHELGLRIMNDVMLGWNDGALFRVPGVGHFTTEKEFTGEDVPDYFLSMRSFQDGNNVAAGTLRGGAATPPDRFVIGTWPGLVSNEFDYTPSTSRSIAGDSAYAVYWTNRSLPAGEKVSFVHYYGASGVTQDLRPPLGVNMFAPTSLSVDDENTLTGNPFTVSADIRNLGTGAANNVTASFSSSPGGLTVGGASSVNLGAIQPGSEQPVQFKVRAPESSTDRTYTLKLTVVADEAEQKVVEREIFVPANGKGRSYVAIGDSTSTGHSIRDCPLGQGSYEYQWGCPVEPGDGPPYPESLAQKLGPPYEDLNRVGVWGYTIKDAVTAYEIGNQTGTDRRDETQWESQLHAVEDARDLVTVSLGANDMRQSDIRFWLQQAATFDTQDEADKLIEQLTKPRGNSRSYMDTLFEVLSRAHENGAEVVINLYYNPYHEPYAVGANYPKCGVTHETAKTITDTLNKELSSRAEANGIRIADFGVRFNPPGDEDHGVGGPDPNQSWVYGNECDVDGVIIPFRFVDGIMRICQRYTIHG